MKSTPTSELTLAVRLLEQKVNSMVEDFKEIKDIFEKMTIKVDTLGTTLAVLESRLSTTTWVLTAISIVLSAIAGWIGTSK
jgi:hypothetical protein